MQVDVAFGRGQIAFLSGEIRLAYLGVGLARKPGPCMRKLLGADWKSAEGIVFGPRGRRRPEGNEHVRVAYNLQRYDRKIVNHRIRIRVA